MALSDRIGNITPLGETDTDQHKRDVIERAGHAIVMALNDASTHARDQCKRALNTVQVLSDQLRTAEDRAKQLETEIESFRQRSFAAENWLLRIQSELQNALSNQPSTVSTLPPRRQQRR
jgi:chromosome segregation ATPase